MNGRRPAQARPSRRVRLLTATAITTGGVATAITMSGVAEGHLLHAQDGLDQQTWGKSGHLVNDHPEAPCQEKNICIKNYL